ncbi:MAG: hypothetical protein JWN17_1965 [Frankiales bacterium]|nr:hypothetical protein [Frankiales bacterium]
MPQRNTKLSLLALGAAAALTPLTALIPADTATAAPQRAEPTITRDTRQLDAETEGAAFQLARDAYFTSRVTAGDQPLSLGQASAERAKAAKAAKAGKKGPGTPGPVVGGTWSPVGPAPTKQVGRTTGTVENVTGRISTLAVDSSGRIYAGAAQGGVWARDAGTTVWTPLTDTLPTLAVGAVAVAPSNEKVVYLGTGEGDLSGDSYAGDGFWRSKDRGLTWEHASGDTFAGVAVSRIVVDPTDTNHLYAATLVGKAGARRVTETPSTPYGVYESTNGGKAWTLRKGTNDPAKGATDVRIDPLDPSTLYASFLGDGIYKSTDRGATWAKAMTGLPVDTFAAGGNRAALGISHPSASAPARLYAGFDWVDPSTGRLRASRVFTSADGAATWKAASGHEPTASIDSVVGYCGTQCSYDNVLEVDPTNADVVYAGGLYNYGLAGGGVYRSVDGGAHWKTLGFDLHPDFHALALQPGTPDHVVLGNDGGVWDSPDRGGRLAAGDPLSRADWVNRNDSGLQITQFTSMAAVPSAPGTYWGGAQDNGTQVKLNPTTRTWYDIGVGDGGQVLVDPDDARYVYGTHYSIDPYRIDTQALQYGGYTPIAKGIDKTDRSEFYVPWVMDEGNTNQLFTGTYRLYRTDNARADKGADVTWKPISGDLTAGCPGTAPNGARGCFISAIGVADGGTGVYTGADDGTVSVSPDAVTSSTPTFTKVSSTVLPARPVTQFAVDRSDWRTAYVSYAGFGRATPSAPGHVFVTHDGGTSWADASNQLPDAPVNSVVLDPADPKRLYAGTDVGPFVTTDGGTTWSALGSGVPAVAVWQLDEDSRNGVLASGTHGRGAWTIPTGVTSPALVVATADTGQPVGPGSTLTYRTTVRNVGNQDATGVVVTVPLPAGAAFVSASDGGTATGRTVSFSGLGVAKQGRRAVTLTVRLPGDQAGPVRLDGVTVTSTQGARTSGSPTTTPLSPARAVTSTPAAQTDGAATGTAVTYPVTVRNAGYQADSYTLSSTGGTWPTQVLDASCTTATSSTGTVSPGATSTVCVRVTVPASAADGTTDTTTLTTTSAGDASVKASSTVTTIAVAIPTLVVDGDDDGPDAKTAYQDALTANGVPFATWDLKARPTLPGGYLAAHRTVVWETGNSYPAPVAAYEPVLTRFLDKGGRLFLSGQDVLDQSAGTTAFVRTYLHVAWDGSDRQNDIPTKAVTGLPGDPVGKGLGPVTLDHDVLGANYEDQVTPIAPATGAFADDALQTDALSVAAGPYKVVFLAFPFEAYGTAADKQVLMGRALSFFGS